MTLSTSIEKIPRIGPGYQKKLKKLGIKTVRDLFFHFPHRYEDFSNIIPLSQAEIGGPFCFQGKILEIRNLRTFRKRMTITQAVLADETGRIKVIWFNQPYLINTLKKDDFVCLAGKITKKNGGRYLSNPAYEKIPDLNKIFKGGSQQDLTHTGRLIPIYPETEGLSSKWLRFIIKPLLTKVKDKISDPLPEKIIEENKFLPIQKAIWQIHFPDSLKMAKEAKERFSFEEVFIISLFALRERLKLAKEKAMTVPLNLELIKNFTNSLPFKLTDDQKKAAWQILKDSEKSRPMNRLLEGDVGSGKTIVALISALNVIKAGYQVAFMAPTEILAKQHFKTFKEFLKGFNLNLGLITGKESYFQNDKISRKELLEKVKEGRVDILIGTHALVQNQKLGTAKKDYNPPTTRGAQTKVWEGGGGVGVPPSTSPLPEIKFKKLALVIIDEQHRFGVEQRARLCQQPKIIPHLLSMTATPIPRTLSLTLYGDLDLSLIKELPKGRKKIITKVIPPKKRQEAYEFIRQQVKESRQVFVICPRIEPSTKIPENELEELQQLDLIKDSRVLFWAEVKAVKEEYEKLSKKIFPDLKIGMLHGKMKTEEKEDVLKKFKEGEIDVLVSTSVVEVGIDIPNASVMMIEGAEKFGLAQLHQFRGRVGRSIYQSFCFLFTELHSKTTSMRLRALVTCENGFELAEKDLAIRGPGDFSGTRQWGIPDIVMVSLKDLNFVQRTRQAAKEVLEKDPELKKYPLLRQRLEEFGKRIHLE
ncbi:MAG: DNA helicase RecG [Candidatus Nealsonbacteria bacterium CG10_big_fil_rev_8_21_14_0_10_36_23]|uniref:Probable DNA 3'-5' helicase RecG n=1 Tax=Candidatus Nealsonbacteria bacterium CG10_big_fil_rev_8_21_14_0_10_36_23 TaxID=1974709 RepID=A0A2H0TLG9_9BACT|nr:MAG: DNA helicase RecG [Candidatus Nealsonbacteria bacterium CG10_big_fil_rev_8_21_14_0_10_36_23]